MPNVLSPRDLVFRPDNMDETVPHTLEFKKSREKTGFTKFEVIHMIFTFFIYPPPSPLRPFPTDRVRKTQIESVFYR